MTKKTFTTSLTTKGVIELRLVLKVSPDYQVQVHMKNNGDDAETIFTDSREIPTRKFLGENRYLLIYEEASYVLVCDPVSILLLVDAETLPDISTGNAELDRVVSQYKHMAEKIKFANDCGKIANELGLPYPAVLSLGGSRTESLRFMESVKRAIAGGYHKSSKNRERLRNAAEQNNVDEAKTMLSGLRIAAGETKTPCRLCAAVYEMFEQARKQVMA